jgi:hypothetical protein
MTHFADDALENFLYTNENEGNYVEFSVASTTVPPPNLLSASLF